MKSNSDRNNDDKDKDGINEILMIWEGKYKILDYLKPETTISIINNKAKSYSIALRAFKPHQALIIGGYEIFKNLSKPEYTYKTITECRGFMIRKAKFLKIMSAFRR